MGLLLIEFPMGSQEVFLFSTQFPYSHKIRREKKQINDDVMMHVDNTAKKIK